MKTKSVAVEVIYVLNGNKRTKLQLENPTILPARLWHTYRFESSKFVSMKDLLKNQIDVIDKKYKLKNIISIKFTG